MSKFCLWCIVILVILRSTPYLKKGLEIFHNLYPYYQLPKMSLLVASYTYAWLQNRMACLYEAFLHLKISGLANSTFCLQTSS